MEILAKNALHYMHWSTENWVLWARFYNKVVYSRCAPMYGKCRLIKIEKIRTWRHCHLYNQWRPMRIFIYLCLGDNISRTLEQTTPFFRPHNKWRQNTTLFRPTTHFHRQALFKCFGSCHGLKWFFHLKNEHLLKVQ